MLRFFLISCALDLVLLAFGAGFWDPCRVMAPSQNQGDQHAILSIDESCKTGTVEWHYPQFDEGGLKVGIMYVRRSEEHTSELQSRETISYAVFCLKKKKKKNNTQ